MLTIKAPAKINWFLHVTNKRPDGFHEIQSLMQCVTLFDTLSFELADDISIETEADIKMQDNLVYKATALLREHSGSSSGARIRLVKEIPMAAGLGGGSSDAAAALLGLNELWGLGLGLEDLMELAAELGSDVPFFISGGPSLVTGRGERLEPLLSGPSCAIALIKPDLGVSAGFAYSGIRQFTEDIPSPGTVKKAIKSGRISDVAPLMKNDLELAVFEAHPEIRQIKQSLLTHGAQAGLMSGSGSTVFGAFDDEEQAGRAVESVKTELGPKGLWSAVVRTV